MLCARIITDNLWFEREPLDSDSIKDLKTTNETLSFWEWPDENEREEKGKVALAMAMTKDKIDEIYIYLIDTDKVAEYENWVIEVKEKIGDTRFKAMQDRHRDFCMPTWWELGFLAEYMGNHMVEKEHWDYYDTITLKNLFHHAIDRGYITKEDIEGLGRRDGWKREYNEYINSRTENLGV